ncbi:MAG TPA: hypothetical protein VGH59_04055 [Casimicrobiaceae bacterium]|jgi:predicted small secreted protein
MSTAHDRGGPRSFHVASIAVVALCATLAGCGGGSGDNGSPPPVNGPAWSGYGRDAQHSALSGIATAASAAGERGA